MSGQSENVSQAHRECVKLRGRVKELEAALAAAEAREAQWRAGMNHTCLRLDLRARSAANVGHARQAEIWSAAADIVTEEYRAALAQADAEGGPK